MATKNAINSNIPIVIAEGGTDAVTLLDNGVLVGNGASTITSLAVGSTGELLTGVTASDPAFDTSLTADFTFTSSTASQTRILTVSNTDNTGAATSAARLDLTVGGANVADPQVSYIVTGQTTWSTGIDNSDSDKYKISPNAALATTPTTISDTDGITLKPLQPAFLAYMTISTGAVTGDGTIFSYICETQVFDQTSDYDTGTGQFTAPISGRYFFVASIRSTAGTPTQCTCYINTSNRRYGNVIKRGTKTGDFEIQCVTIADMDASDVAYPQFMADGAGGVTVQGLGNATFISYFAGYLIC